MIDGRTMDIQVFNNESLTGQIYGNEVLESYVRLFRGSYEFELLFMNDNASPHRDNHIYELLESENIEKIPSTKSLNLNPIET